MWSRSDPGTPRYVVSRRFERTPNLCALNLGDGRRGSTRPLPHGAVRPLTAVRSRPDVEIPGIRRGGDWWWCCRHKGSWAPMGAGASVGCAGVVSGVLLLWHAARNILARGSARSAEVRCGTPAGRKSPKHRACALEQEGVRALNQRLSGPCA